MARNYGGSNGRGGQQIPGMPSGHGSVLSAEQSDPPIDHPALPGVVGKSGMFFVRKKGLLKTPVAVTPSDPFPVRLSQIPLTLLAPPVALGAGDTLIFTAQKLFADVFVWFNNTTNGQVNLTFNYRKTGVASATGNQVLSGWQTGAYANFQFPIFGYIGLSKGDILSGAGSGINAFVFGRAVQ